MPMRFAILLLALSSALYAQQLQDPWETGYTKDHATGAHVLGYWNFDGDSALKDISGKDNDLTEHGAKTGVSGKFGQGVEGFPGFPIEDKPHGLRTANKPALSPKGAFTLEMWIKPKPAFAPELRCYLLDKKYVDHTDYQWQLSEADKGGLRRMSVTLGFGAESKVWHSNPVPLPVDAWQHVAFVYDGAGSGSFFVNGRSAGTLLHAGYAAITPGVKPLSIGDRLGSNHGGFPGFIDEVRICEGVRQFVQVDLRLISNRRVWRRMETAKPVEIICTNLRQQTLQGAKLVLSFAGKSETLMLPDLKAGKSHTAKFTLNTALKPETYPLMARLEVGSYATEQGLELQVVPRIPERMPVIMWGASGDEIARLKDIGFTHFVGFSAQTAEIWQEKKALPPGNPDYIARNRQILDDALAHDLNVVASVSPASALETNPANLRVDRSGKPYERKDICASMPEFSTFFDNVGRSVARAYADHPAFTTVLIDSEVRDSSTPSFNAIDVQNYKQFAHADIPAEVSGKWGVDWTKLKDFPADRVIADDHPILKYYRWFWTVGDGWNGLHTALHRGIRNTTGRRDLWTFFDPAVRQPSISGAGGMVDVLSHWTYTYPDPQRIGLATDQLFAMSAASGRNQQVMKMTQLIWYRSQTAPINAGAPGDTVAWEDHDPEAAYITMAPMHLREAFWTKLARPVRGIMYHGWQSLVPTESTSAYRYTNPNTVHVLKDLVERVVRPLGPTLMQIPDERSEVAFFESFTSQMFARRGGYGSNNGWSSDVWQALQHAHVQCDVMFEETLLKSGLGSRKVLVMSECDVLTKTVVEKITAWQKKGGKIIADEFLCPALKADVVLPSFKRTKKAAEDKAQVLALAKTLEAQALPQKAMCDNPEIIIRTRRYGDALYVFAINDHRTAGNYVGQHGLVLENGLPSSGTLTLKLDSANVYDLTHSSLVLPKLGEGTISWPIELGPCDGKIFMITPRPLLQLQVEVPELAKPGNTATIHLALTDTKQEPIKAIVPVEIEVRDTNGKLAEGSGFYAAKDGKLDVKLDIATNDDPGTWEVHVHELATRMETTRYMRVD